MRSLLARSAVLALALALPFSFARPAFARPDDPPKKDAPKPLKVDLNAATAEQLMELPGVGEATAKKIVAGRPYKKIEDLSAAGLGDALIAKLTPLVTIGKAPEKEKASEPKDKGGKLDLNTATEEQLMELPGVGEAYTKKIIAGRPYKKIEDLAAAGLGDALIAKLTPLVTVGKPASKEAPKFDAKLAAEAIKANLNTGTSEQLTALPGVGEIYAKKIVDGRPWQSAADLTKTGLNAAAVAKLKPLVTTQDIVWVNVATEVFHRPDSRWYGKTKEGVYMLAADAEKAGYRAAGDTEKGDAGGDAPAMDDGKPKDAGMK